jgi:hypothetical protein
MMAGNLFVVDLTYIADFSKVDALLEPHRAFLKSGYDHGVFLAGIWTEGTTDRWCHSCPRGHPRRT